MIVTMGVRMIMAVRVVRFGLSMRMRMTMIVTVIMPMMMGMAKSSEPNDVDQEAESADDEQFVQSSQFMAISQSMKSIENNLYADQSVQQSVYTSNITLRAHPHEKNAISKASQSVDFPVAVRKVERWWPFAHNCCCKTDC